MSAVICRWRLRPGTEQRFAEPDAEGMALMAGAVQERFPETRLQIVDDLVAVPGTLCGCTVTGGRRPGRP